MQSSRPNISHFLSYSAVTQSKEPSYYQQNKTQTYKNQINDYLKKSKRQDNFENSDITFLRNTIGSGSSNKFEYNSYKQTDSKVDSSLRQTTNDGKDFLEKLKFGSTLNFKKNRDINSDQLSKSHVSSKTSNSKQSDNRLDIIMQKYQKKNQTKEAFKLLDQLKQLKKKQQQLKKSRKGQKVEQNNGKKIEADFLNNNSPLNFSKKNKVEYYTPTYNKQQQSSSNLPKQIIYTPENVKSSFQKKPQNNPLKYDKKTTYDYSGSSSYQRENKYPAKMDDNFNKSNSYSSYSYSQVNTKDTLQNSTVLKESVQQYKLTDSYQKGKFNPNQQKYKTNFSASMVTYGDKSSVLDSSNKKLNSSSSYKLLNSKLQNDPFKNRKLTINDFVLGKNLGEGKFGVVYQAYDKKTKSIYALKKVPKDMIKSHWMIDQFVLQIKLQSFLNHQNLLGMFACFDDSTHIYIVLEYMQEGTLFFLLKKNTTLPESQAALKLKQIASAVKYMHENGIAHRDIKPQNIVMSHGVCKLCDFGWATICDQRRKTYCGTFDYAAPQILQGTQYDMSVDLWCLGILAYEIMVGKAPFYHISRKETMKKIMNCQQQKIVYPSTMSKEARSFIQCLIKKNPEERLKSQDLLDHPFLKYATEPKFK